MNTIEEQAIEDLGKMQGDMIRESEKLRKSQRWMLIAITALGIGLVGLVGVAVVNAAVPTSSGLRTIARYLQLSGTSGTSQWTVDGVTSLEQGSLMNLPNGMSLAVDGAAITVTLDANTISPGMYVGTVHLIAFSSPDIPGWTGGDIEIQDMAEVHWYVEDVSTRPFLTGPGDTIIQP
jgi:hypothetical protein